MHVPLLIDDFLLRSADLYPDKLAIVDGQKRFTYSEYQERVFRLAHALRTLGVGQGDRVCMLSPNSHYFLESFFATSLVGAVLVPLNYRLTPADHAYILDHAGVTVVLADYEFTASIDSIRSQLSKVQHWVQAGGVVGDGWMDWDRLIESAPTTRPPHVDRDENEMVSLNYTSGTTARPKGVMLTHRNLYINAYNLIAHFRVHHSDVELWTLPLFHVNGWGGVYALTGMGGTHVILRAVNGPDIFKLIENEKVTFACMAPTVLRTILDYPDANNHVVEPKPRITVAGAPPPAAFIERLETVLGWKFMQIYGLTETSPVLTVSTPDHQTGEKDYARRARAGVSALGVQIKLLDDDGNEVPRDGETVGEICARSNVVFAGYWDQPEETAKAIVDGYFHTGDIAVWDDVGNVQIVDRKKDVIISGGENISSPEVEDALYRHEAVLECAVIGVPSEKWGETPKALVVLRAGKELTEQSLMDFCRKNLAHFKCPTSIEFIQELPRTSTGKLQKFKLRKLYQ